MLEFEEQLWKEHTDMQNHAICMSVYHPPRANNWDDLPRYLANAPDVMDFHNRIIIEYEEESKPQRGPKIIKKGHWSECKHDEDRDRKYKAVEFRLCKIWESEYKKGTWINKLFHFLADCYCKRDTELYLDIYLKDAELTTALKKRR